MEAETVWEKESEGYVINSRTCAKGLKEEIRGRCLLKRLVPDDWFKGTRSYQTLDHRDSIKMQM